MVLKLIIYVICVGFAIWRAYRLGFDLGEDKGRRDMMVDRRIMSKYRQTWYYVVRLKKWPKIIKAIQWLCGLVTNHEFSKTEHGYGGGRFIDQWCRWCNKKFQIPIEESLWAEKNKDLIKEVGKKEEQEFGDRA